MKIIKEREFHTAKHCVHEFLHPGKLSGYSFTCDENGNVDIWRMLPEGRENYRKCLSGEHDVVDHGVICHEQEWSTPPVGLCEVCELEVVLDGFTCTCEGCGADYNSSGQRLAPREQWGEETGEHWVDIVNIK